MEKKQFELNDSELEKVVGGIADAATIADAFSTFKSGISALLWCVTEEREKKWLEVIMHDCKSAERSIQAADWDRAHSQINDVDHLARLAGSDFASAGAVGMLVDKLKKEIDL